MSLRIALWASLCFIEILAKQKLYQFNLNATSGGALDLNELALELGLNVPASFSEHNIGNVDRPSLTAIKDRDDFFVCSANIMTNLHLLTTCRCLTTETNSIDVPIIEKNPKDFFIIAGVSALNIPLKSILSFGQRRDVVDIKIHPKCLPSYEYDYAVAEIDHFLYFTKFVNAFPSVILLPTSVTLPNRTSNCHLSGWQEPYPSLGYHRSQSEGLLTRDYGNVSSSICPQTENESFVESPVRVCGIYLGLDTLQDAGGGLYCQGELKGLLSRHITEELSEFISIQSAKWFLRQFYEEFEEAPQNRENPSQKTNSFVVLFILVATLTDTEIHL